MSGSKIFNIYLDSARYFEIEIYKYRSYKELEDYDGEALSVLDPQKLEELEYEIIT